MKRWGVVAILVLAFCGLADSVYLAQHEASGSPLLCNIQNLSGCNIVANSAYSHIFGIPTAEFGVLFYSILFVLTALELVIFDRLLRRVLQGLALVGLAISIFSTIIQIFFIQALCIYCLASAVITVIIFVLASFIEPLPKIIRKSNVVSPPTPISAPPVQTQRLTMPPAP